MTLNDSLHYHNGGLFCDEVPVAEIAEQTGTPVYIYSLPRVLWNYQRVRAAFRHLDVHIHYSAKANANLALLRALIDTGAGIDAVSAGEIHRALTAGADPKSVVFAGVGKSLDELRYAVEQGIGWFNVENRAELDYIDALTAELKRPPARIALRLNPDVQADTHPHMATGHGKAKFGLTTDTIHDILSQPTRYPYLSFAGIHLHIGSQLHEASATRRAAQTALDLIAPYPEIRTVNIGGGIPVVYSSDERLPGPEDFADILEPLLQGYEVLLEPGRSVVADAGLLVTQILYVKRQAGQTFYIVDAGMTELIRPALYGAHHEIVPVTQKTGPHTPAQVVGPVCETSDVLGRDISLPDLQPGDLLAILTCGAYSMVMASNYNARRRPPEIVVAKTGDTWAIARQRENWADLLRNEML
jgi:diaminopimelate decarboxylase